MIGESQPDRAQHPEKGEPDHLPVREALFEKDGTLALGDSGRGPFGAVVARNPDLSPQRVVNRISGDEYRIAYSGGHVTRIDGPGPGESWQHLGGSKYLHDYGDGRCETLLNVNVETVSGTIICQFEDGRMAIRYPDGSTWVEGQRTKA